MQSRVWRKMVLHSWAMCVLSCFELWAWHWSAPCCKTLLQMGKTEKTPHGEKLGEVWGKYSPKSTQKHRQAGCSLHSCSKRCGCYGWQIWGATQPLGVPFVWMGYCCPRVLTDSAGPGLVLLECPLLQHLLSPAPGMAWHCQVFYTGAVSGCASVHRAI